MDNLFGVKPDDKVSVFTVGILLRQMRELNQC